MRFADLFYLVEPLHVVLVRRGGAGKCHMSYSLGTCSKRMALMSDLLSRAILWFLNHLSPKVSFRTAATAHEALRLSAHTPPNLSNLQSFVSAISGRLLVSRRPLLIPRQRITVFISLALSSHILVRFLHVPLSSVLAVLYLESPDPKCTLSDKAEWPLLHVR